MDVDDGPLRREAEKLPHRIMAQHPTVALARHVVNRIPGCAFVVEVRIAGEGQSDTSVLLDEIGAVAQRILWPPRDSEPDD